MSWFTYKDQKNRRYCKGIWLRIRSLPDDLLNNIKKITNESLAWVSILELRPNSQVLLEVWCYQTPATATAPEKYTVFHLLVEENPEWICEGDLGRGLV